jgi:flagellar basal body-associated protein FliL
MSWLFFVCIGFTLAFTMIVLRARNPFLRPGHPACGSCQYDVTGILGTSDRCPECGSEFALVGIIPPNGWVQPVPKTAKFLVFGFVVLMFGVAAYFLLMAAQARQSAQTLMQQARQQAAAARQAAATIAPAMTSTADIDRVLRTSLTQQQVDAMDREELRETLGAVHTALHHLHADADTRARLESEKRMITSRLQALNAPASGESEAEESSTTTNTASTSAATAPTQD